MVVVKIIAHVCLSNILFVFVYRHPEDPVVFGCMAKLLPHVNGIWTVAGVRISTVIFGMTPRIPQLNQINVLIVTIVQLPVTNNCELVETD